MSGQVFKGNPTKNFVIIATIVFLTILFFQKLNGRFWLNDFKVMYLATKALLSNEQIYGIPFGLNTGFYKYSPFTLLLFIPYTLASFDIASVIHFLIIGFCAISTIIILEQIISHYLFAYRKKNYLILLLSVLLCIMVHLIRELHLGNINMILLFLLSLSLKFSLESNPNKSGFLLALVILAKPYFIICILPFLLHKRHKEIISFGVSIALFILISVVVIGLSKSITLYFDWFSAMQDHTNYLSSNNTIFYLINHYAGISITMKYYLPSLGIVGLFSCIYFWKSIRDNDSVNGLSNKDNGALIVHFFLLISAIPNFLVTDTEHFLFSLPLITIIILNLTKGKNYFWIVLFIPLIFMYGGHSTDLMGRNVSAKLENYGLLGLSNLIIIGTVIFLYSKNKKTWGIVNTSAN